ncbi:MAG: hypothetical protein BM557_04205 [Flavobacterium sp. MedPE-SWcel]|uniref:hypothetical protein n=1 Tax=uncultured Flavobacterium sp. TaxID=165435 RepID=UPI000912C97C|nr:hypothetical protein [uncultured Flavobacterium sp.]OIQ21460.1 MAG: hypothetical protein BM557_04205 [Flavobacterium sp. MedPE-SWcel]
MTEVVSISALRSTLPNDPTQTGEVVYVKYHTYPWDMGGGMFMWRNDNPALMDISSYYSNDNDGTLIHVLEENPQNPNGPKIINQQGRWVRQYSDYINLAYFGGCKDQYATEALQAAIDFAWYNVTDKNTPPTRGAAVLIPGGGYIINEITLRYGVKLMGHSIDRPVITAAIPGDPGYDFGTGYLFNIPEGVVQIEISNLNITGNRSTNTDEIYSEKGVFHFKAQPENNDVNTQAGLWQSKFSNIKITGFNGTAIYSEGGANQYLQPNQFIIFELIHIELSNHARPDSSALKMTGQNGQITFINASFNGYHNNKGEYHVGHVVDIGPFNSGNEGNIFPSTVSFINSTFQEADYGVVIREADNITFDNCWFERLGVSIHVNGIKKECSSINVLNSRFLDASGYGGAPASSPNLYDKGVCIHAINTRMTIANNYAAVSRLDDERILTDYFIINEGKTVTDKKGNEIKLLVPGLEVYGNSFQDSSKLNRNFGIALVVTSVVDKSVECKYNKFLLVNSPNNPEINIVNINSSLVESEILTLRASGGSITFNNEGNIYLTNRASLTLQEGQVATFTKIGSDGILNQQYKYQLTSLVTDTTP